MNKVKIKLHGALAKDAGRSEWNLRVKNVREAISGVQCHWKKFYSSLVENNKKHIGYRVLINGEECLVEEGKDPNSREGMRSSQLSLDEISNLKSIDIIPVIEGSDFMDIFTIFLAIVLIAVGLPPALGAAGFTSVYGAMVIAGVGLLVAGVANLLTPDPEFDDFREIEGGGRPPYTFSGPLNVVKEGGPIFVGYGRLLVGSQVIQTTMDFFNAELGIPKNTNTRRPPTITWGSTSLGINDGVTQGSMETIVTRRIDSLGVPRGEN